MRTLKYTAFYLALIGLSIGLWILIIKAIYAGLEVLR